MNEPSAVDQAIKSLLGDDEHNLSLLITLRIFREYVWLYAQKWVYVQDFVKVCFNYIESIKLKLATNCDLIIAEAKSQMHRIYCNVGKFTYVYLNTCILFVLCILKRYMHLRDFQFYSSLSEYRTVVPHYLI